jgi:hypothetical protein
MLSKPLISGLKQLLLIRPESFATKNMIIPNNFKIKKKTTGGIISLILMIIGGYLLLFNEYRTHLVQEGINGKGD